MAIKKAILPKLFLFVAVASTAPATPACEPSDSGPIGLPGTCVVKANDPHGSHHLDGRINSEVTVKCSEPATGVTVTAVLQERESGGWGIADKGTKSKSSLNANSIFKSQANILCRDGVFRTSGYVMLTVDGITGKSETYHSKSVTNPCGEDE